MVLLSTRVIQPKTVTNLAVAYSVIESIDASCRLAACPVDSGSRFAFKGMVVAQEPNAADTGLRILESGGNAVDAAIATAMALAVTLPSAENIGGGGPFCIA